MRVATGRDTGPQRAQAQTGPPRHNRHALPGPEHIDPHLDRSRSLASSQPPAAGRRPLAGAHVPSRSRKARMIVACHRPWRGAVRAVVTGTYSLDLHDRQIGGWLA